MTAEATVSGSIMTQTQRIGFHCVIFLRLSPAVVASVPGWSERFETQSGGHCSHVEGVARISGCLRMIHHFPTHFPGPFDL